MKVECSPALKNAPGSRMMVSVNLANSPHYDNGDTSESVALWVEDKPGQSNNWYFVLPNMSHKGSNGVVVKLLHGLVISWDGREVIAQAKPMLVIATGHMGACGVVRESSSSFFNIL
jgi:hypothetical protein